MLAWRPSGAIQGWASMIFSDLPFAKLRSVLLKLGFSERVLEGKYPAFYHEESDTFFVFRKYRSRDKVSMVDLVTVRKQLDWQGLMSEEAFEASLRKVST